MKQTIHLILALCLLTACAPTLKGSTAAANTKPAEERATRSDHWVQSGDARLRVSLYRPEHAKGRIPGVVLVQGSAPTAREDMIFYLRSALELGWEAAVYDKRGVGESQGTYWPFDVATSDREIHRLADDAGAIFLWLKQQPDVNPDNIGYMGGSQAGWVMPQAAADHPGAAFVIIGAGTPLTAGAEDHHEQILMSGGTLPEADAAIADYRGPTGYDPAPALAKVEAPVLWIFGSADTTIPTNPSIAIVRDWQAAGKGNFDLLIVNGMNHNFRTPEPGNERGHLNWIHNLAREWVDGHVADTSKGPKT